MTSRSKDARQAFGFFASFAFVPKRNEYSSANIQWNWSKTHSREFKEICSGSISGMTLLQRCRSSVVHKLSHEELHAWANLQERELRTCSGNLLNH